MLVIWWIVVALPVRTSCQSACQNIFLFICNCRIFVQRPPEDLTTMDCIVEAEWDNYCEFWNIFLCIFHHSTIMSALSIHLGPNASELNSSSILIWGNVFVQSTAQVLCLSQTPFSWKWESIHAVVTAPTSFFHNNPNKNVQD